MKNKFIKSIVTLILTLSFLSNLAFDISNIFMPGVSTYKIDSPTQSDGGIDDESYYPYNK